MMLDLPEADHALVHVVSLQAPWLIEVVLRQAGDADERFAVVSNLQRSSWSGNTI